MKLGMRGRAALLAWAVVVACGLAWTTTHAGETGAIAAAAARWPADSTLTRDANVPTLLFFAHPHCPCTRASLHELEWILARSHGNVRALIVFALPKGAGAGWGQTDIHDLAASLHDATLVDDLGALETHRFSVGLSGTVAVYAPSGELLYSGGITESRGHEGANAGRDAVLRTLSSRDGAPGLLGRVFGCPLESSK